MCMSEFGDFCFLPVAEERKNVDCRSNTAVKAEHFLKNRNNL